MLIGFLFLFNILLYLRQWFANSSVERPQAIFYTLFIVFFYKKKKKQFYLINKFYLNIFFNDSEQKRNLTKKQSSAYTVKLYIMNKNIKH